MRDRVVAAGGTKYATISSGTYLGRIIDALTRQGLPNALTTFVVPKGAALDMSIFASYGITRANLVERKRQVLDFDWDGVTFVCD